MFLNIKKARGYPSVRLKLEITSEITINVPHGRLIGYIVKRVTEIYVLWIII